MNQNDAAAPGVQAPGAFDRASTQLWTVRDLLRFAVSQFGRHRLFFGHGTSEAWDEAVYLTLHTLSLPLDRLEPFLDARVLDDERAALLDIFRRRIEQRIPAAYLTGEAWLGAFRFRIDPRVIVPRSYIAEVLREDLAPLGIDEAAVHRVLDLCAGSACLAIIAACRFEQAQVLVAAGRGARRAGRGAPLAATGPPASSRHPRGRPPRRCHRQ